MISQYTSYNVSLFIDHPLNKQYLLDIRIQRQERGKGLYRAHPGGVTVFKSFVDVLIIKNRL